MSRPHEPFWVGRRPAGGLSVRSEHDIELALATGAAIMARPDRSDLVRFVDDGRTFWRYS